MSEWTYVPRRDVWQLRKKERENDKSKSKHLRLLRYTNLYSSEETMVRATQEEKGMGRSVD